MHLKFNRVLRRRKWFFAQQFGVDIALFKLSVAGLLGFSEGAGRVNGRCFLQLLGQKIDGPCMGISVQEAGDPAGAVFGGALFIVFQAAQQLVIPGFGGDGLEDAGGIFGEMPGIFTDDAVFFRDRRVAADV